MAAFRDVTTRIGQPRPPLLVTVTLLLAVGAPTAHAASIRGNVLDPNGRPIPGARIELSGAPGTRPALVTDADGAFVFDPGTEPEGRFVVRADGFAQLEARWSVTAPQPLHLTLVPVFFQELIVTADRTEARLGDTAARAVVLARDELRATPALTVDDALRQVPGFSLFRRSGSRVANPTTQGASLRGVGPSGASRTLVLLDGVPLNDPFGGWVYWSRLPRVAIERLEVVEGGGSDLYGSAALGGVIQAIGRADAPALSLEAAAGNQETATLSLYAAARHGPWGASFAGEGFETEGYVLVAADQRGAIDTAAGSRHGNAIATVERGIGDSARIFVTASALDESRHNGTPLQVNNTELEALTAGADVTSRRLGEFALRGWLTQQDYHQTFSAVSADRTSETITRRQQVPTDAAGLTFEWSRSAGERHALLAGLEARWTEGRSDETAFAQGAPVSLVTAGGRERTWSLFAVDRLGLGSRATLSLGARVDHWNEREGSTMTTPLGPGTPQSERFPDRSETAVAPRVSLLYRATPSLRLIAAGYGAFRAPTLNELYRSFRVGNVVTLANPALTEERLRGGEIGALWSGPDKGLYLRAVVFLAFVEDPIANVTLSASEELTTRQRQNLGQTRSTGLELDGEALLGPHFQLGFGYALVDATVRSFAADPNLVGNRVPQVPWHQITLQGRYINSRFLDVAAQVRASSSQFEDDLNQLSLDGYVSLDLQLSRRLGRGLEALAAFENVTDERYPVGLTPVETQGPPRLVRLGIRFDWRRTAAQEAVP